MIAVSGWVMGSPVGHGFAVHCRQLRVNVLPEVREGRQPDHNGRYVQAPARLGILQSRSRLSGLPAQLLVRGAVGSLLFADELFLLALYLFGRGG